MAIVRITTTRAQDQQALGTAGQLTTDSWSALHSLLLREFSPAHAGLLAEPVANPARGETDWYTDAEFPVRPLASLPALEQDAARTELARLAGDILALAARMRGSPSEADRFLSAMLELAMQLPDEGCIYVQGTRPVLVAWGHAKAGPKTERVYITGMLPEAAQPMAILAAPMLPVPVRKSYLPILLALLALASAVLLAALYVVIVDPLHWYATNEASCRAPTGQLELLAPLRAAETRESDLRLQLAQLSTDAGARRLQCAPPPPPPPPPPTRDEQRARDRGAQTGKVTIILAWDDRNDLDLSVDCPGGQTIYYDRRQACGGRLDIDANGDARTADVSPVENVYFSAPIPGRYRVMVDPYAMRVSVTSRFRLTIKQEGKPDQIIEGVATNGAHKAEVASFTVDAAP